MRSLLRQIEAVSEQNGGVQISQVAVWLGALSQMSADHFRDHYNQCALGTCAAGADIRIEVSEDASHPDALHVILKSVEITDE
ncbi:MAG: hypothetical protein RIF37_18015 [Rhodospirillaceae bacterium]